MDEGRISFSPAVELSYVNEVEQQDLLEQIEENDCTPSLSQACRFKKISQAEGLTPEVIAARSRLRSFTTAPTSSPSYV